MKQTFLLLLLAICFLSSARGQSGHRIEVNLDGYTNDTLVLSFYLAENQYIRDTILRSEEGFVYAGPDTMPAGVYNILLKPNNYALQMLIDEDQHFSIEAKYADQQLEDITFNGSEDNALYYEYVRMVQEYKPEADSLRVLLSASEAPAGLQERFDEIDDMIMSKSQEIQEQHPKSITAAVLRLNNRIDVPDFEGLSKEDAKMKRYRYYKHEYLALTQLEDARLFRSPFQMGRLTSYLSKLTIQHPDSISLEIDEILSRIESTGDADYFQFYLVHFINTYSKMKVVGFDAIYVHLAEEYYAKGKAPWVDKKQLSKIVSNARAMKATLIGKVAPDVTLYTQEKEAVRLHEVEADYTILYFWSPTCGHCKKSTPKLVALADSLAAKNVKIVAICNKVGKEEGTCWDYVNAQENMDKVLNLNDPNYQSKFKTKYYVKSTPKLFILDKDKQIVSKDIGVDQINEVLRRLMSLEEDEGDLH